MIKLDPKYQTVVTKVYNGASVTTTTDTLFVSDVRIDFTTGAIYATIRKGTGNPFVDNDDPPEQICVNPDGTFVSQDGSWSGSLGAVAPAIVASLKTQFDQFVLASGAVTGTLI